MSHSMIALSSGVSLLPAPPGLHSLRQLSGVQRTLIGQPVTRRALVSLHARRRRGGAGAGTCRLTCRAARGEGQTSNLGQSEFEEQQQEIEDYRIIYAGVLTSALFAVCLCVAPEAIATADTASTGVAVTLAATAPIVPSIGDILRLSASKAFKGGVAGFLAGVAQVTLFMWLRTTMNVQYALGGGTRETLSKLWAEGGVRRLYQGFGLAVIEAPLIRFGDTAANAGMLSLLGALAPWVPLGAQTAAASAAGAGWRLLLTPLDTFKTTRQVRGEAAVQLLMTRVQQGGVGQLYAGALAGFAASWVGSYPWFAVYNALEASVPAQDDLLASLLRSALIGCCASATSDTISNSLRVLKTVRQTSPDGRMSYQQAAAAVIEADGLKGLFGRGLQTRLATNVVQGAFFSVAWKLLEKNLFH